MKRWTIEIWNLNDPDWQAIGEAKTSTRDGLWDEDLPEFPLGRDIVYPLYYRATHGAIVEYGYDTNDECRFQLSRQAWLVAVRRHKQDLIDPLFEALIEGVNEND